METSLGGFWVVLVLSTCHSDIFFNFPEVHKQMYQCMFCDGVFAEANPLVLF